MTLYGEYLREDHRRIHKWYQYFPAYEKHFERFRNRHVTIFEIGIGEGGSLEMWRRYFGPYATIVGMDVYQRCKQVEEPQVHVRIGSQADIGFLASVVDEFGPPDIVIDDGSHLQHHVNATFEFLYPLVAKNGVYLVEDLHAAYWSNHGGGLRAAGSFIETAKSYVDRMHVDYIGDETLRSPASDRTTSIHFYDSVVVLEVGEKRVQGNKMTGNAALFDGAWVPPGETREAFEAQINDMLRTLEKPGEHTAGPLPAPVAPRAPTYQHGPAVQLALAYQQQVAREQALRAEIDILRRSTSWRLTSPLRAVGRLLKK